MRHQLSFVIKARKLSQTKTQLSGLVEEGGSHRAALEMGRGSWEKPTEII